MPKDYSKLSKEKLIELIEKLESRKKYGLVWDEEHVREKFEKEAENALPIIREISSKALSIDDNEPTNVLIEGDNYHSLSVLNYSQHGKIDFIYIDPPYNTGAKDWKYNNSYVDASDSWRHSKWVNFMARRLKLAWGLLKDDGVICVTIDDNEMPRLWMLMEEIFSETNHLGTVVIRNNPKGRMTNRKFSLVHEYALFFGKSQKSHIKLLPVKPEDKTHKYIKDDDGSWYVPVNLRKQGIDSSAKNKKGKISDRYYPIYFDPQTGKLSSKNKYKVRILPIDGKGEKRIWRRSRDVIDEMSRNGELWAKEQKNGMQIYYKFRGGLEGNRPQTIWYDPKFSASEYGTQMLDEILGSRELFQFPKSPHAVIQSILAGTNNKNATILDFFAGSGTTGQAVLELNNSDGGKRKFILCTNNENNIATEVCYPRIKRVIKGINNSGKSKYGYASNLRYFKTSFIRRSINKDDLKVRITQECTEMLCLREGVYNEIKKNSHYRVFRQGDHILAVYYSLDKSELPKLKAVLDKIKGEKILYCFTLDPLGLDKSDFIDWQEVTLEPIPQKILDIYEQIYEY